MRRGGRCRRRSVQSRCARERDELLCAAGPAGWVGLLGGDGRLDLPTMVVGHKTKTACLPARPAAWLVLLLWSN